MKKILPFLKINEADKQEVGNKAIKLADLAAHGINVAKFFVLSTGFFEEAIATEEIKFSTDQLTKINLKNWQEENGLEEKLGKIKAKIEAYDFQEEVKRDILNNFRLLKTDKVSVRSSATCEDQVNSSFAGQFESYLSIAEDQLLEAIKKCWQSVFTEQVFLYCLYHKIDFSKILMAVIVQEMVFAEIGGVIFTKDIINKDQDKLIIEAAAGLGERVVSGIVNPQRIVFLKSSGKLLKVDKEEMALTPAQAKKLFKVAMKIESIYQEPQDIEWAIKDGRIFILQSRPITG